MRITPEEERYLEGGTEVQKNIYTTKSQFEIDRKLLLEEGALITVRPHTRFIEFPEHRHNYIEIMYVCQGQITHHIDGQDIVLKKGDILLLNQHVRHSVKRAGEEDIGINFIALPEFFDIPLQMLGGNNVLAEFLINILRQKNGVSQYLLFQTKGDMGIENLMENMIASMTSSDSGDEDTINQYSMGITFLYLLHHAEHVKGNDALDYEDIIVQSTLQYIDSWYKTASLGKLADDFHQSLSALSKLIKKKTGYTFQEILQRKRFQKAVMLLMETDLPIEEIAVHVGYENHSYFYRQFKNRYGMTPRKYRVLHRNDDEIRI